MNLNKLSATGIEKSVQAWFVVTVFGQLAFVYYITVFFAIGGEQTNFQNWRKVAGGLVDGDTLGNLSIAAHLFLSAVITIIGPMQLLPAIRNNAPRLHKACGKIYVASALLISISGLYMVWGRGADAAGFMGQISASTNGVLIIVAAIATVYFVFTKRFQIHQTWATRLFLLVSGVWFFRIGLQAWLAVQDDPLWIDMASFSGQFISFWNFGCYLVPLLIFEFYRTTKSMNVLFVKLLILITMFLCVLATLIGCYAAMQNLWGPRIESLY